MPSDSASDPKSAFAALFRQHWDAGTGRQGKIDPRYKSWTTREFLDAMEKAGNGISNDTLNHWLHGENVPQPEPRTALLKVLFPKATEGKGDTADDRLWNEMDAVWKPAWYGSRPRRGRLPPAPPLPEAWPMLEDGWDMGWLVQFLLHEPVPVNEQPGAFYVPATLRLGQLERTCEHGTFAVSLNSAFVEIPANSYQLAKGMIAGAKNFPHDHFVSEAGGARIIGPHVGKRLHGDVLLDEHLAMIEEGVRGGDPLTVRIVASPSEIDIVATEACEANPAGGPVTVTKSNLMKLLVLDRCKQDSDGRAILAQHRRRRSRPE